MNLDVLLKIARNEFDRHECDTFRHWSFIVQNKTLLEWGRNRLGDPTGVMHLGYQKRRHSLHAEVVAFKKARGLLDLRKPWQLYNIRLGANKELRLSAPCTLCSAWISASRCSCVYFTTNEGQLAKLVKI